MKINCIAKLVLLFLILSFSPLQAGVEKGDIPSIITAGLNKYKSDGAEAAIKVWIKGSAMEKKMEESISYAKSFEQVGEFYGKYLGYKVIELRKITETSLLVFVSMDYELGPVFAKFLAYKKEKSWILISFDFNTKPEVILPSLLL